jgi:hypothetical protein
VLSVPANRLPSGKRLTTDDVFELTLENESIRNSTTAEGALRGEAASYLRDRLISKTLPVYLIAKIDFYSVSFFSATEAHI